MLGFVHCSVRETAQGMADIDRRCLGGFTVLSTKAVSSLLTSNGFNMFKQWMTYPFLAVSSGNHECAPVRIQRSDQVLIGTGVGQIKYLNRALIRFDSKASRP